jgi:hypothetical protein
MVLGKAPDVQLVDDHIGQGAVRTLVRAPDEGWIDDRRQRGMRSAVTRIEGQILLGGADGVAVQTVVVMQVPAHPLGVRIEQQLARVVALPPLRSVRPIGAQTVQLPRPQVGEVAVPHVPGDRRKRDPPGLLHQVGRIEQADVEPLRALREHREVHPPTIPGRPQRVGVSTPDPHSRLPPGNLAAERAPRDAPRTTRTVRDHRRRDAEVHDTASGCLALNDAVAPPASNSNLNAGRDH